MQVTLDLDGQETVAYVAVMNDLERIAVRVHEAPEEPLDEQLAERCERAIADLTWILEDAYALRILRDTVAGAELQVPVATAG